MSPVFVAIRTLSQLSKIKDINNLGGSVILRRGILGTKAVVKFVKNHPLATTLLAFLGYEATVRGFEDVNAALDLAPSFFEGAGNIVENLPTVLLTCAGGAGGFLLSQGNTKGVQIASVLLGSGFGAIIGNTLFTKDVIFEGNEMNAGGRTIDPKSVNRDPNYNILTAKITNYDVFGGAFSFKFLGKSLFPICDSIRVSYDVKNTSNTDGYFWCGLSFEDVHKTEKWKNMKFPYFFDVYPKNILIPANSQRRIDFGGFILYDTPPYGSYKVWMAVWSGFDDVNNLMVEPRYDIVGVNLGIMP